MPCVGRKRAGAWRWLTSTRLVWQKPSLVREAGGDGFIRRCDVRDYSQLTALAQACEEQFGGIDIIVNNAGVASGGFFSELSLEDWDWQISINLMGVVKGCKAFLPLLEKARARSSTSPPWPR